MKRNVGGRDRTARIAAGLALLGTAAVAPLGRRWRGVLGMIGSNVLASGASGYCPVNAAMGVNTARRGWTRFLPVR